MARLISKLKVSKYVGVCSRQRILTRVCSIYGSLALRRSVAPSHVVFPSPKLKLIGREGLHWWTEDEREMKGKLRRATPED